MSDSKLDKALFRQLNKFSEIKPVPPPPREGAEFQKLFYISQTTHYKLACRLSIQYSAHNINNNNNCVFVFKHTSKYIMLRLI